MMNALLGTKFKIVSGYKGVSDLNLALERGEIDGQVSPWSTWKSEHPDWLKSGKIVNIIATGAPATDLPGVPVFADLVKDARAKALVGLLDASSILGRSIAAPRGTPRRPRASPSRRRWRGGKRSRIPGGHGEAQAAGAIPQRRATAGLRQTGARYAAETVKTFLESSAPSEARSGARVFVQSIAGGPDQQEPAASPAERSGQCGRKQAAAYASAFFTRSGDIGSANSIVSISWPM